MSDRPHKHMSIYPHLKIREVKDDEIVLKDGTTEYHITNQTI